MESNEVNASGAELDVAGHPRSNDHWLSVGIDSEALCEELAMKAVERTQVVAMDVVENAWSDGSTEKQVIVFDYDRDADVSLFAHVASGLGDDDFELVTAMPRVNGDYAYAFTYEASTDFHGPTEGLIWGSIHEHPITFGDPLFLTNRGLLDAADEMSVSIAAVAYSVVKVPDDAVVEVNEPELIRALSPDESEGKTDEELEPFEMEIAGTVSLVHRGDAEYDLLTVIQEVEETEAFGKEFYCLTVGFFLTEEFELDTLEDFLQEEEELLLADEAGELPEPDDSDDSDDSEEDGDEEWEEELVVPLTLYVEKSRCEDSYVPLVGDTIEVSLWLQGVILDEEDADDEDESESEEA